ncbi:MAG: hypothetical protein WD555_05550 [Fulvivirga sp.]
MKFIMGLFFILLPFSGPAQILDPVQWETEVKKSDDKTLAIFITATLDSGWHLYSQHLSEGGPVKTSIALHRENKPLTNITPWVATRKQYMTARSRWTLPILVDK